MLSIGFILEKVLFETAAQVPAQVFAFQQPFLIRGSCEY